MSTILKSSARNSYYYSTSLILDLPSKIWSTLLEWIKNERLAVAGIATTGASLVLVYNWPGWNRHRYPPGPIPLLPFVGHSLWFIRSPNIFKELYGKTPWLVQYRYNQPYQKRVKIELLLTHWIGIQILNMSSLQLQTIWTQKVVSHIGPALYY